MKAIIFLGDGMSDHPVLALGGRTPLMVANTPAMDWIAHNGRTGLLRTLEPDMPSGSAVANLSVLGYDPRTTFQGRGVLEAASLGVDLAAEDVAARINLICIEDGKIRSHSAGHIANGESHQIITDLIQHLNGNQTFRLVPGLSYRHLLVLPQGDARVTCAEPHDHVGESAESLMVRAVNPEAQDTADSLNHLIRASQAFLKDHPVNRRRIAAGQEPANSLWPWSPGRKPKMQTLAERYGISGAVITAVDLIKGLGIYAGMDVIEVEGATGLYDTNCEGKADACLAALADHDLVYVHVESPDEAGHARDLPLKIRCIEDLDQRLIQRVLAGLTELEEEVVVAVLPDHPTPVEQGIHHRDPVPVAIWDPARSADGVARYDEENVKAGSLGLMQGAEFIETVLGRRLG